MQAYFLGSAQPEVRVETQALRGEFELVFLCPETLHRLLDGFLVLDSTRRLSLVAFDEAHCISAWGHDFRPHYARLASVRTVLTNVPLMALTATATAAVRDEIVESLGLRSPELVLETFVSHPPRSCPCPSPSPNPM